MLNPHSNSMLRSTVWSLALASASCLPLSALAETKKEDKTYEPIRAAFVEQYGQRFDTNKLTTYLNTLFQSVDFDQQGISAKEVSLHKKMSDAQTRAQVAGQILRYDLDADGIVERSEVEQVMMSRNRRYTRYNGSSMQAVLKKRYKKQIDQVMQGDPNNDGKIEASEYAALAKNSKYKRYSSRRDHAGVAEQLLKFDPDKDGNVTQTEAMLLLAKAFHGVNITPPKRPRRTRNRITSLPASSCKAPKVPEGAELVMVGAYEGSAVSSVTVAGQDKETSTAKLKVEAGSKPLYLVMSSYSPMLWRVTGETDRIARVLLTGRMGKDGKVASGLTGVAKDKVSFLPSNGCLRSFYKTGGIEEARAAASARRLVGKKPLKVLGQYSLNEMSVPSGDHQKASRNGGSRSGIVRGDSVMRLADDNSGSPAIKLLQKSKPQTGLKRSLFRFNPGGVIKVDPASVVSDGKAADYDVLPQQAGLIQLVSAGALEELGNGQFKIVKKMRYPAGLYGAHRVKFLLKEGVPEPEGQPGHSCVFSEDKGEAIAGHCR